MSGTSQWLVPGDSLRAARELDRGNAIPGRELLAHRTRHFLRRDVLHVLIAAVEIDARWVAVAFGDNLDFKAALLAAEHIAGGRIPGVGV